MSLHTLASLSRLDSAEQELLEIVHRMLAAIHTGDIDTYRSLSLPDVSCYEADVAPYRIDVVEFHLDLMTAMHARDQYHTLVRYDILTPRVQLYSDTGIVTYTRLMTYASEMAPSWRAFNETRVFVKQDGSWKMAHFHRSHAPI